MLVELASVDPAPTGARVNALIPASTDTGMAGDFAAMVGGTDNLVAHTGLARRSAEPREMALPLLFLKSGMAELVRPGRS